jgi:hypothetical protein
MSRSNRNRRPTVQVQAATPAPDTSSHDIELLRESLAELEQSLAQDSIGWQAIGEMVGTEFSRDAIRQICKLARLMWLKNPLIRSAVDTQMVYVFGQGVTIRANDPEVNDVVQAFLDDSKNQAEFTSHQSRQLKEIDLRLFGNLFFVFFIDVKSGRVRVRTLPVDQVEEIVRNPEDAKEPWFYLRAWTQTNLDGALEQYKVAYPDWRYSQDTKPTSVRGYSVDWDHPVYHVKTGCLGDMKFGVSEVYPALDWAKAYKMFLEDWATLTRAYSRFAHKLTLPSQKMVAGAKAKLGTTYGNSGSAGETNPPPVTGSTFIASPGVDISPIRIGGANVSMEDGRRLLLMVCAAVGLPETFMGDTSVGSLATAKSLDRPTELRFRNRQTLWGDVHQAILGFVIEQAVRSGALKGQVYKEEDGTPRVELAPDEEGEPRDATVTVDWPGVLEHDTPALVGSIVDAATMRGQPQAGVIAPKTVSKLLLQALSVDDVDSLLDELYPEVDDGEDGEEPGETPVTSEPTVSEFANALREVRTVLAGMVEGK